MFFAYVIRSCKDQSLYKGHCQDLEIRLSQHNAGSTPSIKHKIPFELVYWEAFDTREEAINREKYFKSASNGPFGPLQRIYKHNPL